MQENKKRKELKKFKDDFLFNYVTKQKFDSFRKHFYFVNLNKIRSYGFKSKVLSLKRNPIKKRILKLITNLRPRFAFEAKRSYEYDKIKMKTRRKLSRFHKRSLTLKKYSLFFNKLTKRRLYQFFKKSLRVRKNSLTYLFQLIESRLDSFLWRTQLFDSKSKIPPILRAGAVMVNGKKKIYPNFMLKDQDIIEFKYPYNKRILKDFKNNLIKDKIIFETPPDYIMCNYNILSFIFLPKLININKIPLPFEIDLNSIKMSKKHLN